MPLVFTGAGAAVGGAATIETGPGAAGGAVVGGAAGAGACMVTACDDFGARAGEATVTGKEPGDDDKYRNHC